MTREPGDLPLQEMLKAFRVKAVVDGCLPLVKGVRDVWTSRPFPGSFEGSRGFLFFQLYNGGRNGMKRGDVHSEQGE